MQKMTGARECSKIERFGVDVKGKQAAHPQRGKVQQELRRQRGPERQRCSRAAHSQKNRKAQQERGVVERRSGEPSKC